MQIWWAHLAQPRPARQHHHELGLVLERHAGAVAAAVAVAAATDVDPQQVWSGTATSAPVPCENLQMDVS